MTVTSWLVVWGIVTTAVLVLAFYRLTLGLHEDPGLYIDQSEAPQAEAKAALEDRITKVEFYGKRLTALSVVLIVVTAALWVYNALSEGQRLW